MLLELADDAFTNFGREFGRFLWQPPQKLGRFLKASIYWLSQHEHLAAIWQG